MTIINASLHAHKANRLLKAVDNGGLNSGLDICDVPLDCISRSSDFAGHAILLEMFVTDAFALKPQRELVL